MAAKDDFGRRGEDLAARWVTQQGWRVIERNWRGKGGELDLVALDGDALVGVEVKTRSSLAFGHPVAAVTPARVVRMRHALAEWLAAHPQQRPGSVRLDVVAILWPHDGEPRLAHLAGVS